MERQRYFAFLAALLLLSVFGSTAFADGGNTSLTVNVPFTVTLQVGDHGKVTVDGTDYTGNARFQRDAGTVVTYTFTPNGLYSVDKAIYNGVEVTDELSGNTYTAPALTGNATLEVSFKLLGGLPNPPHTGDSNLASILFAVSAFGLGFVLLILITARKRKAKQI